MRRFSTWLALLGPCLLGGPEGPPPAFAEPPPRPGASQEWESVQRFQEARALHRTGRVDRALGLYAAALEADPGRLEVRPYYGLALVSSGRAEEALEQYRLYLAAEPEDVRVRLGRVAALLHLGRAEEALEELERLEGPAAGLVDFHLLRGAARRAAALPGRALDDFTRALAMRPGLAAARIDLACSLLDLGRLEEAREVLEALLREPDLSGDADALNTLGVVLARQGDPAAGSTLKEAGDRGLPLGDLNALALEGRAAAPETLLVPVAELLDRAPRLGSGHLLYGWLLYRCGRLEEAARELRIVLEGSPGLGLAEELLGLVCLAMGELDEARARLERAVMSRPEVAGPHHNLSCALRALGELEEALKEALTATALAPHAREAWAHLGWIHDLSGQPRQALEAYRRALALEVEGPRRDRLLEHVAELEAFLTPARPAGRSAPVRARPGSGGG